MAVAYCHKCGREIYHNAVIITEFHSHGWIDTTTICEDCHDKIHDDLVKLLSKEE